MTRYVAFLRAVNVGGRIVKMDRLRGVFESLGYSGVQTFIASGNVIFESSVKSSGNLERAIEAALQEAFGFPVATFVRSIADLTAVAKHRPFNALDDAGFYIVFVRDEPSKESQRKVLSLATDADEFRFRGREVYWRCRGGFAESMFSGGLLEKTLGMDATVRNSTTVRKVAAKFCP